MAKADVAAFQDKYKVQTVDMVQLVALNRSNEKKLEQQHLAIENLEKLRDNQSKTIAENTDTVSIVTYNQSVVFSTSEISASIC